MTELTPADLLAHINHGTTVSAGDTLVLGVSRVSAQQAHQITEAFKAYAPDVKVVLVEGVEQMATVRLDYDDPEFERWFHKHLRMQGATCPCRH